MKPEEKIWAMREELRRKLGSLREFYEKEKMVRAYRAKYRKEIALLRMLDELHAHDQHFVKAE